jgi:hypothetical protein
VLELGDASGEVDAGRSAVVLGDLFEPRFGQECSPAKVRELGREIPDERIELGESGLLSWFVV